MPVAAPVPAAQDDNLVLYNPQGNVPLSERKTAALQLMTCKAKEVVLKGPARTGKSLAMVHRVNIVLSHYAGARALLVRKTRSSLNEAALADYEGKVIPRNLDLYPDCQAQQLKIRSRYDYPNGSVLVVAGMDTPERVMSTEYDVIAVQEATELTEHDWELLLTRLSHGVIPHYQQIMGDMNPTSPSHWLNKRIAAGLVTMLYSRHEDNPRWWDGQKWTPQGEAYLDTLKRLSGVRYKRLYMGVDAAAEGAVYPEWHPEKHVVASFPIPQHWRRIRSIDFGFNHPFVCQWWAMNPDGVMFLYREWYRSQMIVEDHAKRINQLSKGEVYEATLADHDAEDRATLHRHGIKTKAAYKGKGSVRPGIDACTARLRGENEKPTVFFFRDARVDEDEVLKAAGRPTSTIDEVDGYHYDPDKGGMGKEEPVKEFDDGCDTWRYATCYVDDVARRRFKLRGGRVTTRAMAGSAR